MRYLTAGESHGNKLVVIVDDVPSGIKLDKSDIEFELKRRSKFAGRSGRQEIEDNSCEIISGIKDGKTTGNPVSVEIYNQCSDASEDEEDYFPRPGHADLNGVIKRNFDSCWNVSERSSARETAARIVSGVIAKNFLADLNVEVFSWVESIGSVDANILKGGADIQLPLQSDIEISKVMCPDEQATVDMIDQINRADASGETLGGKLTLVAKGLIPGIGGYSQAYDRLDSKISSAVFSVPSVKGVEIGDIAFSHKNVGSVSIDNLSEDSNNPVSRHTNYAGGIEGGMTNGMPVVLKVFVKPVPSVKKPVKTIDLKSMNLTDHTCDKRSDVCAVPGVAVVCESELALVLANEYQNKFGHDDIKEIKYAYDSYVQRIKSFK